MGIGSKRSHLSNSEIERHYFEKFRAQYQLPSGSIKYGDKPDVIIYGQETIGIEITRFYADSNGTLQSQIAKNREAVKIAQNCYQEKTKSKIEYAFGFNLDVQTQKVCKSAKNLEILAERFSGHPVGPVEKCHFLDMPEISSIWRKDEYEDSKWEVSQVFSTSSIDVKRLREIIKRKESKAKRYDECDKLWLLIVVDFMNLAQDQEIMNMSKDKIQSDCFDKIILYRTVMEHIREVSL